MRLTKGPAGKRVAMPATLSKATPRKEKEERMAVDSGVASPTSAVSSDEEDPLASKYSGKMRGFSQESEQAKEKESENPKKRLSFKETPGKTNPNLHIRPLQERRGTNKPLKQTMVMQWEHQRTQQQHQKLLQQHRHQQDKQNNPL